MSTLTVDNLIEQGIAALRSGDRRAAVQLLFRATQEDPANQRAWLWLAAVAPGPEGMRNCLERVIAIDPASPLADKARAGLAQLGPAATTAITPPATTPSPTTLAPEPTPIPAAPAIAMPSPSPAEVAPQTVVASPETVIAPAPPLSTLPPTATPAPTPRTESATVGRRAPWADIVLIIASCAALGWFIGRGMFLDFWVIGLISSVSLCGLPSAIIYHGKGRSALVGFFVGSGLGIIGLLIVAISEPDRRRLEADQLASGALRRCPSCAELVRSDAKVCHFCQRDLPAEMPPQRVARRSSGRIELFAGVIAAVVLLLVGLFFGSMTGLRASTSLPDIEATIDAGLLR